MRPFTIAVFVAAVLSSFVYGQKLSVGVIGGGSLTDSFQTGSTPSGSLAILRYSASKDYAVGPMVELNVLPHWSVEVDGMFRKLHLTTAARLLNGSLNSVSPSPVITWEFPVLAKYRFEWRKVKPFAELGPSFRTAGNLNGANPSHRGFTAGVGLEARGGSVNIAPVLRYTRWAEDNTFPGQPESRPDQLELLVGFSVSPESQWRPLGRHFSVGIAAGVNLTGGLRSQSLSAPGFGSSSHPIASFIAGPIVELELVKFLYVETDAIYHRLRSEGVVTFDGRTSKPRTFGIATWELPVLAKYKLSTPFLSLRPFIEAGPSFRLPSAGLSHYGATAGIGVETHLGLLKIAPVVRYTHWARDSLLSSARTFPNQVEFLVRFTL